MKKLCIVLLVLLTILFMGCDDNLSEPTESYGPTEQDYKDFDATYGAFSRTLLAVGNTRGMTISPEGQITDIDISTLNSMMQAVLYLSPDSKPIVAAAVNSVKGKGFSNEERIEVEGLKVNYTDLSGMDGIFTLDGKATQVQTLVEDTSGRYMKIDVKVIGLKVNGTPLRDISFTLTTSNPQTLSLAEAYVENMKLDAAKIRW